MSDLFFLVKATIFTFLVVLVLQAKVGSSTVEQRAVMWMHDSVVVDNLKSVAEGAVALAARAFHSAHDEMSDSSSTVGVPKFELSKRKVENYYHELERKRARTKNESAQPEDTGAASQPAEEDFD